MSDARNPLVREIEEAALHRRYSRDGREAFALTQRIYWPRIRAALEAAHALRAAVNPQTCTDDVLAAMQAYDEAKKVAVEDVKEVCKNWR